MYQLPQVAACPSRPPPRSRHTTHRAVHHIFLRARSASKQWQPADHILQRVTPCRVYRHIPAAPRRCPPPTLELGLHADEEKHVVQEVRADGWRTEDERCDKEGGTTLRIGVGVGPGSRCTGVGQLGKEPEIQHVKEDVALDPSKVNQGPSYSFRADHRSLMGQWCCPQDIAAEAQRPLLPQRTP
ncbi:hypothetical protein BC827DRAFT_588328 [Russula dissimulans]|nr:hypothetical protein BC827DRAFT_588328 [Russula dissimulans]